MSNGTRPQARRTASIVSYNSTMLGERVFIPGALRRENADLTSFALSCNKTEMNVEVVEASSNRPAGFMLSTTSADTQAISTLLERLFPRTVVDQIMAHYGTYQVIQVAMCHITVANRLLNIAAAKSRQATATAPQLGSTLNRLQQSTATLQQLADPTGIIPAKRFPSSRPTTPSPIMATV